MARIKIDFDNLQGQISSMASNIQQLEALNAKMRSLSEEISSTWEGNAAREFVDMMQSYMTQGANMHTLLETFRNYAGNVTSDFDAVDQECANAINNSF